MRRFTRFSLASLLLMVVLVAAGMSAWRIVWIPVRDRMAARQAIAEAGLQIETEPSPGAWFWGWFYTDDQLARPVAVRFTPVTDSSVSLTWSPRLGYDLTTVWDLNSIPSRANPVPLAPELWPAIGRLVDLEVLELSAQADFPPEAARQLAQLRNLKRLDLAGTPVRDEDVVVLLSGMESLESLNLSGTLVTANCLPVLRRCPNLEQLRLPRTVRNSDLIQLPELPLLRELVTSSADWGASPDATVKNLRQLSRSPLTTFGPARSDYLACPVIVDQANTIIGTKANDTRMRWHHGLVPPRLPKTPADRAVLGEFAHLTELDLSHNRMTSTDLDWLTRMVGLEELTLGEVVWTKDDWRRLRELPHLKRLNLPYWEGTGSGPTEKFLVRQTLAGLSQLSPLDALAVTLPTADDDDIALLAQAPTKELTMRLALVKAEKISAVRLAEWQQTLNPITVYVSADLLTGFLNVGADDLARLDLSDVENLSVHGPLTVLDAEQLLTATSLDSLAVQAGGQAIPTAVVKVLATHPSLTEIDLRSQVEVGGLTELVAAERLTNIFVARPRFTVEDVRPILSLESTTIRRIAFVGDVDEHAFECLIDRVVADGVIAPGTTVGIVEPGTVWFRHLTKSQSGLTTASVFSPWVHRSARMIDPRSLREGDLSFLTGTDTPAENALRECLQRRNDVRSLVLPWGHPPDELIDKIAAQPVEQLQIAVAPDQPGQPRRAERELARAFSLAGRLPKLTELQIISPDGVVSADEIDRIAGLTELTTLDVQFANTDAAGRDALGRLTSLTELRLTPAEAVNSPVAAHDSAFLRALTQLDILIAPDLWLSGADLERLTTARPKIRLDLSPVRLDRAARKLLWSHPVRL